MATGLKISDLSEHVLSPTLGDFLEEVEGGDDYHWSIIELDGALNSDDYSIFEFERKIKGSDRGWILEWNQINLLSSIFSQIYDLTLLGSRNLDSFSLRSKKRNIYETCDFVLALCDSSYWEVFSKDPSFLERVAKKFQDVDSIESPVRYPLE